MLSGSVELIPVEDSLFVLTASNARGQRVSAVLSVRIEETVHDVLFFASPSQVEVSLTWNLPNARYLKITANGKYTVISRTGALAESGTATVYPNEDTTYTLVAHNTLGDQICATQSVAVPVKAQVVASPGGPVGPKYPVGISWTVPGSADISGLPHSQCSPGR